MNDLTIQELETATGGRYEVEGFLAQGGMGAVYTARNRALGSRVAIKVLPAEVATNPTRLARFKREAALAANLSHPHIVPVFEFDASQDLAYLVMPFVEGETLADYLRRHGRMDYATVREMIGQVAGALGFAHSRDVVHRDIKPANILREEATGRWLVTDFGVAHVTHPDETEITQTGAVIGTPAYMAPEQRFGAEVDGRSDLYSLAAVAYQAICGIPAGQLPDNLARDQTEIERSVRSALPGVKPAAVRALAWPLAVAREDRPDSAETWLEALEAGEGSRTPVRWVAAATLGAALIVAWLVFRPTPQAAGPSTPTVAVLPFQIDVRDDTNDLGTLLPQAFDWQLEYLPDHRILGPSVRRAIAKRYGASLGDPDSQMAVAIQSGATMVLEGRARGSGDALTILIRVHDAASRQFTSYEKSGSADSLDVLVSDLVVEAFAERVARELTGLASSLPHGLVAINAYVQGERDFRKGAYEAAISRFDEVIRTDSTFAPAHFKRMLAVMLDARPTRATARLRSALHAARAYRAGLDPVSRQLLAGYEVLLTEGDIRRAEGMFGEIVYQHPGAVDAWFVLGYLRFNFRALLETSVSESRYAFERADELHPGFAAAIGLLASVAVLDENKGAAHDYLTRFIAADSVSAWAELARMMDSLLYRGTSATVRVLGSFADRPTEALELIGLLGGELRPPAGTRPIAQEALRTLWRRAATPGDRQVAFRMRLAHLLGTGRFASADSLVREARRMRGLEDEVDRWIVLSAILEPVPDLGAEPEQAASVRRLRDAEHGRSEARWLAARWYQRRDLNRADELTQTLRELAADSNTTSPLARSLRDDLEAMRSLAAGDTAQAWTLWEEATQHYSVEQVAFGLVASLWPLRVAMAAVALDGTPEQTLEMATSFDQMAGFADQVAWPEILRLRAEATYAAGDLVSARRAYTELLDLLKHANGEGITLRERTAQALAQLGS